MSNNRMQILSYGGGVQTVAMIAEVLAGRLPRPDMIVAADTGRERSTTWGYMNDVINPALDAIGLQVEIAPHTLATVDLYSGNGDLLIPGFTGSGKLPTFCSNEWKQRVIMRYLRGAGVEQCDIWIGFSTDEAKRAKPSDAEWMDVKENTPDDFRMAIELEQETIEWDGVYFHTAGIPLADVEFHPERTRIQTGHHQCSMGFCWV